MAFLISLGETPTRLYALHRPDQRSRGPVQADTCCSSGGHRHRLAPHMAEAIVKAPERTASLRLSRANVPIPLLFPGLDGDTRYNLVNPPVAGFVRHGRYCRLGAELPVGTPTGASEATRRVNCFLKRGGISYDTTESRPQSISVDE